MSWKRNEEQAGTKKNLKEWYIRLVRGLVLQLASTRSCLTRWADKKPRRRTKSQTKCGSYWKKPRSQSLRFARFASFSLWIWKNPPIPRRQRPSGEADSIQRMPASKYHAIYYRRGFKAVLLSWIEGMASRVWVFNGNLPRMTIR